MKKRYFIVFVILFLILCMTALSLWYIYNYIPHKQYTNDDFDIKTYISDIDYDQDGIDDQTDILKSVRSYIKTKPQYKSDYYIGGYPNDGYGVCTDIVAQGLLGAGYDLMYLVNDDILKHSDMYDIEKPDINIDFRRVRNLKVYFKNTAIELTTDVYDIDQWQGGDIVIFTGHIGVISDKRNHDGVSFLIHHSYPGQRYYEEDILAYRNDIVAHYRIS